jgi:hypothetical protein
MNTFGATFGFVLFKPTQPGHHAAYTFTTRHLGMNQDQLKTFGVVGFSVVPHIQPAEKLLPGIQEYIEIN